MRIYLDLCCFNRPYDDQSQLRIRLESEAKLQIQQDVRNGEYELAWSYILDYENSRNPSGERRSLIAEWCQRASTDISESQNLLIIAREYGHRGLKNMDALHVACAVIAKAAFFITTDDIILGKAELFQEIAIVDPIGFIKETAK